MKWLKQEGCPWVARHMYKILGNKRNLEWLEENGCPRQQPNFLFSILGQNT